MNTQKTVKVPYGFSLDNALYAACLFARNFQTNVVVFHNGGETTVTPKTPLPILRQGEQAKNALQGKGTQDSRILKDTQTGDYSCGSKECAFCVEHGLFGYAAKLSAWRLSQDKKGTDRISSMNAAFMCWPFAIVARQASTDRTPLDSASEYKLRQAAMERTSFDMQSEQLRQASDRITREVNAIAERLAAERVARAKRQGERDAQSRHNDLLPSRYVGESESDYQIRVNLAWRGLELVRQGASG